MEITYRYDLQCPRFAMDARDTRTGHKLYAMMLRAARPSTAYAALLGIRFIVIDLNNR